MYVRLLRLRHLQLRPAATLVLLEGSMALGVLLALAEAVSWWGALAVPVAVAAMVKFNDVVAGAIKRYVAVAPPFPIEIRDRNRPVRGVAAVPTTLPSEGWPRRPDVRVIAPLALSRESPAPDARIAPGAAASQPGDQGVGGEPGVEAKGASPTNPASPTDPFSFSRPSS